MKEINSENCEKLLKGVSLLSTGGGGSFDEALELSKELVEDKSIEVKKPEEISSEKELITSYGIGSPAEDEVPDEKKAVLESLEVFLSEYEGDIGGVVPAETGPLAVFDAMVVAAELEVPLIDADLVGGRSVPDLITLLTTQFSDSTSSVGISDGKDLEAAVKKFEKNEQLEGIVREMSKQVQNIVFVTGHPIKPVKKDLLFEKILSKSFKIGEKLQSEGFQRLENIEGLKIVGKGKIESIDVKETSGFFSCILTIKSDPLEYEIKVKNEFMSLKKNGKTVYSAPDSICILDLDSKIGPYSSQLEEGDKVAVLCSEAPKFWKTGKGSKKWESIEW